ncbi:MAG: trypsin-like peptidase domain-containing protein [Nitrososphaeraceae archaeon]|nr:trypsin-like peptidase domain-containing protein [Nitrososphaeraceae archaeon]
MNTGYWIESVDAQVSDDHLLNSQEGNFLVNDSILPDIFSKVEKSVVKITQNEFQNNFALRLGSGFVYDTKGHIITNYHVIAPLDDMPKEFDITFSDGSTYKAQLVGFDPFTDLAILKAIDVQSKNLIPLPLADSSLLKVGQTVVAIGNPFGLSASMTVGIVSGLGRLLPSSENTENTPENTIVPSFSIPDIIQTDAAINPGNSGGPLLNIKGEVVGINTAIFSNTGVYSGVGFAIPSNTINKVVPILINEGEYQHPYLGIVGFDVSTKIADFFGLKDTKGFLITDIATGSPAEKAGLTQGTFLVNSNGEIVESTGDIIFQIDDKPVRKIDDILTYLEREKKVGDNVELTIYRNGELKNFDLELTARPTHQNFATAINPESTGSSPLEGKDITKDNQSTTNKLYETCIFLAGKGICDFLFQR